MDIELADSPRKPFFDSLIPVDQSRRFSQDFEYLSELSDGSVVPQSKNPGSTTLISLDSRALDKYIDIASLPFLATNAAKLIACIRKDPHAIDNEKNHDDGQHKDRSSSNSMWPLDTSMSKLVLKYRRISELGTGTVDPNSGLAREYLTLRHLWKGIAPDDVPPSPFTPNLRKYLRDHDHVIRMHGWYIQAKGQQLFGKLVLDYAKGNGLQYWVQNVMQSVLSPSSSTSSAQLFPSGTTGPTRFFLPQEVSGSIAYQILRGLKFAHSRGVVNRDIKIDNILVHDDHISSASCLYAEPITWYYDRTLACPACSRLTRSSIGVTIPENEFYEDISPSKGHTPRFESDDEAATQVANENELFEDKKQHDYDVNDESSSNESDGPFIPKTAFDQSNFKAGDSNYIVPHYLSSDQSSSTISSTGSNVLDDLTTSNSNSLRVEQPPTSSHGSGLISDCEGIRTDFDHAALSSYSTRQPFCTCPSPKANLASAKFSDIPESFSEDNRRLFSTNRAILLTKRPTPPERSNDTSHQTKVNARNFAPGAWPWVVLCDFDHGNVMVDPSDMLKSEDKGKLDFRAPEAYRRIRPKVISMKTVEGGIGTPGIGQDNANDPDDDDTPFVHTEKVDIWSVGLLLVQLVYFGLTACASDGVVKVGPDANLNPYPEAFVHWISILREYGWEVAKESLPELPRLCQLRSKIEPNIPPSHASSSSSEDTSAASSSYATDRAVALIGEQSSHFLNSNATRASHRSAGTAAIPESGELFDFTTAQSTDSRADGAAESRQSSLKRTSFRTCDKVPTVSISSNIPTRTVNGLSRGSSSRQPSLYGVHGGYNGKMTPKSSMYLISKELNAPSQTVDSLHQAMRFDSDLKKLLGHMLLGGYRRAEDYNASLAQWKNRYSAAQCVAFFEQNPYLFGDFDYETPDAMPENFQGEHSFASVASGTMQLYRPASGVQFPPQLGYIQAHSYLSAISANSLSASERSKYTGIASEELAWTIDSQDAVNFSAQTLRSPSTLLSAVENSLIYAGSLPTTPRSSLSFLSTPNLPTVPAYLRRGMTLVDYTSCLPNGSFDDKFELGTAIKTSFSVIYEVQVKSDEFWKKYNIDLPKELVLKEFNGVHCSRSYNTPLLEFAVIAKRASIKKKLDEDKTVTYYLRSHPNVISIIEVFKSEYTEKKVTDSPREGNPRHSMSFFPPDQDMPSRNNLIASSPYSIATTNRSRSVSDVEYRGNATLDYSNAITKVKSSVQKKNVWFIDLVMERVHGQQLNIWLETKATEVLQNAGVSVKGDSYLPHTVIYRCSPRLAASIILQITQALQFFHGTDSDGNINLDAAEYAFVHGDLRPYAVFVNKDLNLTGTVEWAVPDGNGSNASVLWTSVKPDIRNPISDTYNAVRVTLDIPSTFPPNLLLALEKLQLLINLCTGAYAQEGRLAGAVATLTAAVFVFLNLFRDPDAPPLSIHPEVKHFLSALQRFVAFLASSFVQYVKDLSASQCPVDFPIIKVSPVNPVQSPDSLSLSHYRNLDSKQKKELESHPYLDLFGLCHIVNLLMMGGTVRLYKGDGADNKEVLANVAKAYSHCKIEDPSLEAHINKHLSRDYVESVLRKEFISQTTYKAIRDIKRWAEAHIQTDSLTA